MKETIITKVFIRYNTKMRIDTIGIIKAYVQFLAKSSDLAWGNEPSGYILLCDMKLTNEESDSQKIKSKNVEMRLGTNQILTCLFKYTVAASIFLISYLFVWK